MNKLPRLLFKMMKLHPFHFVVLKTLIKTIKIIKNESCFSVPLFRPITRFLRFANYQTSSDVKKYQSHKTFNEDKEELIWMFQAKPRQMSQKELYALFHTTSHHHPCHKSTFDWLSLHWAGFSIVLSVNSLSTHLSVFVRTSQSEVSDSGYTLPCIIIAALRFSTRFTIAVPKYFIHDCRHASFI